MNLSFILRIFNTCCLFENCRTIISLFNSALTSPCTTHAEVYSAHLISLFNSALASPCTTHAEVYSAHFFENASARSTSQYFINCELQAMTNNLMCRYVCRFYCQYHSKRSNLLIIESSNNNILRHQIISITLDIFKLFMIRSSFAFKNNF